MAPKVSEFVADQAAHLRLSPLSVSLSVLRAQTVDGLDVLALRASAGRWARDELIAEIRQFVESEGRHDIGTIDNLALAGFARAMTGWVESTEELTVVADLFQAVRLLRVEQPIADEVRSKGHFDRLDAQSNLAVGRLDYVARILPDLVDDGDLPWGIRAELDHPIHGQPGSTWESWLESFNSIFVNADLDPIALEPGEAAPFDRVIPGRPTEPVDGPLVTIVTSVFKPDQSLITSLRSLIDQSWTNLEILVVDDASPEEYQPLIEEAVALDDRIRLHRMPVNGGTYRIRNYALEHGKGEFIAFQDADDWSHPQRIERQINAMMVDPEIVACFSKSIRLFGDLSVNKLGFRPSRRNVSSMVIRREVVVETVGMFDSVRKSGDSEYADRVSTVFGPDRLAFVDAPLAMVQLTDGSLSREDFRFGWRHPERVLYKQAFEHWHHRIAAGLESPYVEPEGRPFPAPPIHLRDGSPAPAFDVAVVNDWRGGNERYNGHADELKALSEAGLSVATLSAEAMRTARISRMWSSPEVLQLAHEGAITQISWLGEAHARLVIIRDPEVMSFAREVDRIKVRADRVVIHADIPTRAPEGGWRVFDPKIVEANVLATFGVKPEWLPATEQIADSLRADGAVENVLAPAALGVVAQGRPARLKWGRHPVVGLTGMDKLARDRPSAEDYFRLLPQTRRIKVLIRDTRGALDTRAAPKPLPKQWHRDESGELGDFVDRLDVLVLPPWRSIGPVRPWAAVRAAADGVIVVAPRQYECQLGSAAIYLDGRTAEDVVRELGKQPDVVANQRRRALQWYEEQFRPGQLIEVIKQLLG